MPAALSYPGVYVEEIPSGVHTITGVATSITAFVGRTERGPVNVATPILSYADYQRTFGNLTSSAPVAYAVRDFFLNGGSQAVVVRLFATDSTAAGATAAASANNGMTLSAKNAGDWGANLLYSCDLKNPTQSGNFFNLSIYQVNPADANSPTLLERYTSLSISTTDARRTDLILAAQSNYVQAIITSATVPTPTTNNVQFTGGATNGTLTVPGSYTGDTNLANKTGLYALEQTDLFNLLCIPPDTFTNDTLPTIYSDIVKYCTDRRAMLIVDPPSTWDAGNGNMTALLRTNSQSALTASFTPSRNAAIYFPRVIQSDPAQNNQPGTFAACGIIAGLYAQTDVARGVWKAPAGTATSILGIQKLAVNLTDGENGLLNPVGINCLRYFKASGNIIWGARTLRGSDQLADDYKYVPVRRLALFIEESLYRGTQWAVFEPNDAPLWGQLRLSIGTFMHDLFRQGAFQGSTPKDAYLVKCDGETTTQSDINNGIVNVLVAFAPLKPAEFVVLQIQQLAGQLDI